MDRGPHAEGERLGPGLSLEGDLVRVGEDEAPPTARACPAAPRHGGRVEIGEAQARPLDLDEIEREEITPLGEGRAALAAGDARGADQGEEQREDRGAVRGGEGQRLEGERARDVAEALEPERDLGDGRSARDEAPAERGGRRAPGGVDEQRLRRAAVGERGGEAIPHDRRQPFEGEVADAPRLGARPPVHR